MQEIAPNVFIETGYAGVTLGALSFPHGLIQIDAPILAENIRSWQSTLMNLGGGVDRLLINLDAHTDRLLGVRSMESTVIAHADITKAFKSRPAIFKGHSFVTGGEWELYDNLGNIRWAHPALTFTDELTINWNDTPLVLKNRPGPCKGSIWADLPQQRIIFLGDAVMPDQPPFLENANLDTWLETLAILSKAKFREYIFISSRCGLVHHEDIHRQITILKKVRRKLNSLAKRKATLSETQKCIPSLLENFEIPKDRKELYYHRMLWGLSQYYKKNYLTSKVAAGRKN
jgi:glyoxylase-like metal-dependent hydrolase (beta-lactamase superfamily II)